MLRHLMEKGTIDTDGIRHSTKVAWRVFGHAATRNRKLEGDNLMETDATSAQRIQAGGVGRDHPDERGGSRLLHDTVPWVSIFLFEFTNYFLAQIARK